jgi:hypothetical protein
MTLPAAWWYTNNAYTGSAPRATNTHDFGEDLTIGNQNSEIPGSLLTSYRHAGLPNRILHVDLFSVTVRISDHPWWTNL